MQAIRALVEGFLRGRYGYEGLGVARLLAVPVLVGAIVVVGWLLMPWLTIPRISSDGPVVRNGVAAVMVCGEKRHSGQLNAAHFERLEKATRYAPEPRTGTWGHEERDTCTIFYHHPPGFEQRQNRQERASLEKEGARTSPDAFQELPVVEKLP